MNTLPIIEAGVPVLDALLPLSVVKPHPQEHLNLILLIYQRALDALDAFERGNFPSLDAPAGDQACQIRALKLSVIDCRELSFIKEIIYEKMDKIKVLQSRFFDLNASCQEQVKTIKTEILEPLSKENKKIADKKLKLIKGLAKSDPEYKAINLQFAPYFKKVNQQKKPALAKIDALNEACLHELSRLIEEADLEFCIDPEVVFLVRCYLVALAKVEIIREEMGSFIFETHFNLKNLNPMEYKISKKNLLKVVNSAKEAIRSGSISFIQEQSAFLLGERGVKLQKIVENPRFVESKGRKELSFFHLTQVIFQRAMQLQIPILLKVRNEASHPLNQKGFGCSALFKSDGNVFEVSKVLSGDLASRVIVIESFSKKAFEYLTTQHYLDELLQSSGGLLRLIDLNSAQHGQYTDQIDCDSSMFETIPGIGTSEKESLIQLFTEAVNQGFSSVNSDVLCIEHIYCDLLANQREALCLSNKIGCS